MSASRSARVFAALGDEHRLRLVQRLGSGEALSIVRLTAGARITRQAMTKHLLVLQRAGVVRSARRGRERLYSLDPAPLDQARRDLGQWSAQWDGALDRLRTHVEE